MQAIHTMELENIRKRKEYALRLSDTQSSNIL